MRLWNANGDFLRQLGHDHYWARGLIGLPDNRFLTWRRYGELNIWSLEGELLTVLTGHSSDIVDRPLVLLDGRILTADEAGHVRLWSLDGQSLNAIDVNTSVIQGVFQHADGRLLFWGSNGSLYAWSLEDSALIVLDETLEDLQMIPELSNGNFLSWNRDFVDDGIALVLPDERLITIAADNTFQLRNPDGQVIRTYQGHKGRVNGVRLLRDGRLLSWSDDQTLRFWQVDVEESIDYACTRVFRDFTDEERVRYNIPPGATCSQFAG
jgi:WD40 repeat protein